LYARITGGNHRERGIRDIVLKHNWADSLFSADCLPHYLNLLNRDTALRRIFCKTTQKTYITGLLN
jgi:hypothetical protein